MFGIILLLDRFWFCSLSNKITGVTNGTTFTERVIPIFGVSFMRGFNVQYYVMYIRAHSDMCSIQTLHWQKTGLCMVLLNILSIESAFPLIELLCSHMNIMRNAGILKILLYSTFRRRSNYS